MSEERTSILSVGADRYVLRACHRHVDETVALCSPRQWDYGPIVPPDRVRILRADDPGNPESALGALYRAGLGDHRFDAVHTTDEFALVSTSVLAEYLGSRSLDALRRAAVPRQGAAEGDPAPGRRAHRGIRRDR